MNTFYHFAQVVLSTSTLGIHIYVSPIWMSIYIVKEHFPNLLKTLFPVKIRLCHSFLNIAGGFSGSQLLTEITTLHVGNNSHWMENLKQQAPVLGWQGCPCDTVPGDRVIGESSLRRGWACCWRAWVLLLLQKNPGMIMSAHQIIVTRMDYEDNNFYWVPDKLRQMRKKDSRFTLKALIGFPQALSAATAAILARECFWFYECWL